MALAVAVRFDFVDGKGKTSFTKLRVPTGYDITTYVEFAQGAAQILSNASAAAITNVSITFNIATDGLGLSTIAATVSDVYHKAIFLFNTSVAGFKSKFLLPTISETIVIGGSDSVDQADPQVAALIAAETNGILISGAQTVTHTDSRGHDLTAVTEAREIFRKKT